jgi:oligopeptide/dipeptide ABC transporter ATP-binding protein
MGADVPRLAQIPGSPPSLLFPPAGCRFHTRCEYVMNVCRATVPELRPSPHEAEHVDACHLDEETKEREAAKLVETMMAEEAV